MKFPVIGFKTQSQAALLSSFKSGQDSVISAVFSRLPICMLAGSSAAALQGRTSALLKVFDNPKATKADKAQALKLFEEAFKARMKVLDPKGEHSVSKAMHAFLVQVITVDEQTQKVAKGAAKALEGPFGINLTPVQGMAQMALSQFQGHSSKAGRNELLGHVKPTNVPLVAGAIITAGAGLYALHGISGAQTPVVAPVVDSGQGAAEWIRAQFVEHPVRSVGIAIGGVSVVVGLGMLSKNAEAKKERQDKQRQLNRVKKWLKENPNAAGDVKSRFIARKTELEAWFKAQRGSGE